MEGGFLEGRGGSWDLVRGRVRDRERNLRLRDLRLLNGRSVVLEL